MYYPRSEKKGADQLRGYREADLRLCFRLGRLLVFPCGGSYIYHKFLSTWPVIYFSQVLDANHEYQKMTEIYEEKRQEILCGMS